MRRKTTRQEPKSSLKTNHFPAILGIFVTMLWGCAAAGPRPLSIKMFNAQTNSILNCEARDLGLANRDMLANTVEACARQLEKIGYVRQSSSPLAATTP